MEYCKNLDLQNYIKNKIDKNEKIQEDFIWKVAYQTLDALNYLHIIKKMAHLDIKPLNLLLDVDNNIKISDFGLSGIIPIISEVSTTLKISNTGGTEKYIPPEAIKGQKRSFKFDIWALGVTLYYMAQSQLPFTGTNTLEFQ
jgi:serine/threonine protein kinase